MRALATLTIMSLSLGLVVSIYFWKLRPLLELHPKFAPYLQLAATHRGRAWEWVKLRWAEVTAGLAFVLPEIPTLITELTGIDWTSISPSPLWATVARVVGVLAIAARFLALRKMFGGN